MGIYQMDHPGVFAQGLFEAVATAKHEVGTVRRLNDGRTYVYAKNGSASVALAAGKLCVAATVVANHVNQVVGDAAAIGDTTISVDIGATALTENQYAGGYLAVNDATGEGHMYKVGGHPAADASDTSISIAILDEVRVALVADTSEYSLHRHPYDSVAISATDQADMPVGIPPFEIPASYYFWLQTGGPINALADATIAVGKSLTIGTGTAGAVQAIVLTEATPNTGGDQPVIGVALQAGVDTEYRMIDLTIKT